MKTCILILCYGITPDESQTINSLLPLIENDDSVDVVIWNNGPKIWCDKQQQLIDDLKKCHWIESIHNRPLSSIYNDFLDNFESTNYIIFDHDTEVNSQYIYHALNSESVNIGAPIIRSHGRAVYPMVNKKFKAGPYSIRDLVVSITSGLLISKPIVALLKETYGSVFDERFALYGVDTSFFYRLHELGLGASIICLPQLSHSLSRFHKESPKVTEFRDIERSIDFALMHKHYVRRFSFIRMLFCVLKAFLGLSRLHPNVIFHHYLVGKHPRSER